MKPIAFWKMTTKDELRTRIKNGQLSVGANLWPLIKNNLLSETKTDEANEQVLVKYAATYGTKEKIYFI